MNEIQYQGTTLRLVKGEMQVYGIAKIKEAVRFAGGFYTDIKDALTDGKFSWIEAMRAGLGLASARKLIEAFGEMRLELADLSEGELREIADEAIMAFRISTANVSAMVVFEQKIIPILAHMLEIVRVAMLDLENAS